VASNLRLSSLIPNGLIIDSSAEREGGIAMYNDDKDWRCAQPFALIDFGFKSLFVRCPNRFASVRRAFLRYGSCLGKHA
jgi:hypothetical protein